MNDWIIGADFELVIFQKPSGVTAEFGFGTNIRSGAKDDPESIVLAKFDEPANVVAAFPVKLALGRLKLVPENVDADGVKAHGPGFFDAVFPELVRYAGWMDFAGDDFNGLAVDFELAVCAEN